MTTFDKFINDWRERNMNTAIVKPQGAYRVNSYRKPSDLPMHICSFRELDRNIAEANAYAAKHKGCFVQILASSGKLVYDTRHPEQRQAERCPVCLNDLDRSRERIEIHGLVFDSLQCLVSFEDRNKGGW